jgi:hypothetical protein
MTSPKRPLPAPEDLPRLYLTLTRKVEWMEGAVRQLLAESARDHLLRPTWKDLQDLQAEVARLRQQAQQGDA